MVVFICRILGWTAAAFPLTFCLVVQGFEKLYGPPAVNDPVLLIATPDSETTKTAIRNSARDDAGRECRPGEIQIVEVRVEPGPDAQGGHVALATPSRVVGFRARNHEVNRYDYLNPFASPVEGVILDDSARRFSRTLSYRVSPQTLRLLEESIDAHASDGYQLGNWQGGRNCATWVQDRLRDAGLTPPPGDCPNRIAWYVPIHAGRATADHLQASRF